MVRGKPPTYSVMYYFSSTHSGLIVSAIAFSLPSQIAIFLFSLLSSEPDKKVHSTSYLQLINPIKTRYLKVK